VFAFQRALKGFLNCCAELALIHGVSLGVIAAVLGFIDGGE
jgi:hypothetical protein